MKNLKLLIALVMLLSLVGCTNTEVSPFENEGNTVIENQNNEENNTDVSNKSNEKNELTMGTWNDSLYTNDFLDIQYTLPEGWICYSDEEIANLMNISTDLTFGDQEFMKEVAKLTAVYYIFTQNPINGNNVSLVSEKPIADVTIDYYMDQLEKLTLAVDTLNYEIVGTSTQIIGDREFKTLEVTVPEYNLTQKYFVYKLDKYFISIVATSTTGEEGINEIINCFK